MRQAPIEVFLEHWYSQPMWGTLRRHPRCLLLGLFVAG